eukprot:scaffold14262_cov87-Phaeocystis_antarctica.AAC.1
MHMCMVMCTAYAPHAWPPAWRHPQVVQRGATGPSHVEQGDHGRRQGAEQGAPRRRVAAGLSMQFGNHATLCTMPCAEAFACASHSLTASQSSSRGQTRPRRTYYSSTTTPRSTLGRSAGAAAERCCRPTVGDMISGHDATPEICCGAKVLQE